ncbi:MAG: amino acid adenylation domain-containing protein [Proteobacteria bacterium]|nr:amino acid adenylation domain-containing protein [Pseudomonadota bacterium]
MSSIAPHRAAPNGHTTPYPRDKCIHELFSEWVKRTPERIALTDLNRSVSYREVDAKANQLAHQLRRLGVDRDVPVAVCAERSANLITCLLAVLKAGGAYLPLDTMAPVERIALMLDDASPAVFLGEEQFAEKLSHFEGAFIRIDDALANTNHCPTPPVDHTRATDLAYIMYTSGSTGRPKAVCVPHRAVVRLVRENNFAPFRQTETWMQFTPFWFDPSTIEIWGALLNGAHLVVCPPHVQSAPEVANFIRDSGITSAVLITALFETVTRTALHGLAGLELLIVGGEALPPEGARRFLAACPGARLVNGYGPTENATVTTFHTVTEADLDSPSIPIGKPISNTRVYVLDAQLQPVGPGECGELCAAGDGLARGYLNRPEENAERFVAAPHLSEPVLYRTGDLVRRRHDGVLQFHGRLDSQVKIGGYRIEPSEVEAALARHENVHEAAVAVRTDANQRRRLVAYVVTEPRRVANSSELRRFLQRSLPPYMIPDFYVAVDQLPLTRNGKLDRDALPEVGRVATGVSAAFHDARTEVQEQLVDLWTEAFDMDEVGIADDFTELGGDSLLAAELVGKVNTQFDVSINSSELLSAGTIANLADDISCRAEHPTGVTLRSVPRNAPIPLSSAQQRIYFVAQQLDDIPLYNQSVTVTSSGPISATALERALQYLVVRHQVLRSTIHLDDSGQPHQIIGEPRGLHLPVVDLRLLQSAQEREDEARRCAREMLRKPFRIAEDLMMRGLLVHIDADTSRLYLAFHHIASDGRSIAGILRRELPAVYACFASGREPDLAAPSIQYADYAVWQRRVLAQTDLSVRLMYWQKILDGAEQSHLPGDRPRPPQPRFQGRSHYIQLPARLWHAVQSVARQNRATPFVTLLSAFLTLVHRYTGKSDLLVGTIHDERNHPALADVFGHFANPLPLRAELSGHLTFTEVLDRVTLILHGAQRNELPLDVLVHQLNRERSQRTPLVSLMFAMIPPCPEVGDGWLFDQCDLDSGTSKFDLTVSVEQWLGSARVRFEYDTDLFDAETIERLAGHYQTLIENAVADPRRPVKAIEYIPAAEMEQLMGWGDIRAEFPVEETIHQRFAAQARRTPDAIAVVDGDGRRSLTYGQLDAVSSQLARYLQSRGIGPATTVGLCMERGVDLVAAILAILKAGAIYVPLDTHYPAARLSFIIDDAAVTLVVTHSSLLSRLDTTVTTLCVDREWDALGPYPHTAPPVETGPDSAAYIIYTSGSTGRPKGVVVNHANVVRLLAATDECFQFDDRDVWCLFHSINFDFSVWELFGALLYGGRLVVVPHATSRIPDAFYRLLCQHGVTVLCQTPSAFHQLSLAEEHVAGDCGLRLRYVIFGGEALEPSALRPFFERHSDRVAEFINMYGITETTVHVTYRPIRRADVEVAGVSSIGRPIADLEVRLLDQYQQPVPIGIPGEIHVGGAGLATGYLNLPDLTAERFVPHPMAPDSGRRLYRSGDLARYLANGDMQYLGRLDHQVKIRGFRIELGEIERALVAHPAISEAVVVCVADSETDKRLWAYVVAREQNIAHGDLRAFLASRLPDYMLPAGFVAMAALPLTAHGKVDRGALPPPAAETRLSATGNEQPETEYERRLCELWAGHLRVDGIGVSDDFFSLGGHSMLGVSLCFDIQQRFDLPLDTAGYLLRGLLQHSNIRRYAAWLTEFVRHHKELPDREQVDFFAEAQLDPSIEIASATAHEAGQFSDVLLTGATGFLGAGLLQTLLRRTAARIHCLVRARDLARAWARLDKAMDEFPLSTPDPSWKDRIIPIPGDLSQPLLGLSRPEFDAVAGSVDLILHNGARVNFVYPYSALRDVNVGGTEEIIRLASLGRATPVHYISTLSVPASLQFQGVTQVGEDDPVTDPTDMYNGYLESKWVSEQMLLAAHRQGLPVSIYRPKDVSGHSATGRWRVRGGFLPSILHAMADLGAAPVNFLCIDMQPVDHVSEAIVHMVSTQEATGTIYHLTNSWADGLERVIQRMGAAGYPIERCAYDDWCERLKRYVIERPDAPISPFAPLYLEQIDRGIAVIETHFAGRLPQFDNRNTRQAMAGAGLPHAPMDDALIDLYIAHFVDSGFFPSPHNTYAKMIVQAHERALSA